MRNRRIATLTALTLAGAVVGTGAAVAATTTKLTASLSAKKEVGNAGPTGAKGTFVATISGTKLCYTLKFSGLSKPLAAHIHRGTATQNGSIVVDLKPKFSNGKAAACVPIKSSVASAIRKDPKGYYANVHTQKNPDGAIRGQLSGSGY
ncbi:MAG TPA: CHRD domain-containing protein [Baekduia sp.]|jgi:predicted enzyme involved in methoxymalonyl-ACP biosynthesis|nr:CHRD domain-containing protein [Baekduia sp.]